MTAPLQCPLCQVDLRGTPVSAAWQAVYPGQTHYSRALSLYLPGTGEALLWRCPDCGRAWHRHPPGHRWYAYAERIRQRWEPAS